MSHAEGRPLFLFFSVRSKHIKGYKKMLFIRTKTRSANFRGVIPFVRLQNDTETTVNGEK